MTVTEPEEPTVEATIEVPMGWSGVIAQLNTWTSDHRLIRELLWPDLPLTVGIAHFDDTAVGSIDVIEIRGDDIWAQGRFSDTEDGRASALQLTEGTLRHVSIEPREGEVVVHDRYDDEGEWVGESEEWLSLVMGAVAFARVPAFTEAAIAPDVDAAAFVPGEPSGGTAPPPRKEGPLPEGPIGTPADPPEADEDLAGVLLDLSAVVDRPVVRTAGVGPITYPSAHFARPEDGFTYAEQTRLTISPDGEVTGHVLPSGARSRTNRDDPWVAARNPNDDLSEWLVGAAHLDDGRTVLAGVIVSDGLHGPAHQAGANGDRMRELIESTAHQVAQVTAWWDDFGLAVHGSTLPGVKPEQATRAMAGCPSVDERWFDARGWMTTGVLCVNTCRFSPGQAVMRVASGAPTRRVVAASTACGCGGPVPASGGACGCGAARSASAEDEEKPGEATGRQTGRLAQIDREFERERLRAAAAAANRKG